MLSEQSNGIIDKSATVQQSHKKQWYSKIISFQNNLGANEYRKDRRFNGLQLPLHPLQIVGWITLIVFVLTSYLVIIPTFRQTIIRLSLYVTLSVLLVIHVVTHIAALIIDPADIELRKISTRKVVPEFDRSKHSHVIENGRCHLCNIKTSSQRTKHCSVCNKCVQAFDHHCKYLNSCVSKSRNYVPFLMCVASAVAAVLVILAAAIAQIVLFYVNPNWLNLWDKTSSVLPPPSSTEGDEETSVIDDFSTQINQFLNNTVLNETFVVENATLLNSTGDRSALGEGIGLYDTIFLVIVGIVAILAAITAGLLLHLFFFHMYICYLGLTTYEYIRNHRQTITSVNGPSRAINEKKNCTSELFVCSKLKASSDTQNRPKSLHCCERTKDVSNNENLSNNIPASSFANTAAISQKAFYVCTVLEEETSDIDTSFSREENATRTLHCCSEFSHITKSQHGVQKIIQYSEQCAFCSFRIKPLRKIEHQKQMRCCMKTNISKHHRWRRKWNCCSNIPNSPEDAPGINSLQTISSYTNQPSMSGACANTTQPHYVQIEIPIDSCANNSPLYQNNLTTNHRENNGTNVHQSTHDNMRSISTISAACSSSITDSIVPSKINNANNNNNNGSNNPKKTRSKLVRPWPVRLRYVFRMINRYRRPRCRGNGTVLKQNQVRPLPGSSSSDNMNNEGGNNDDLHSNAIIPSAPAPNRRKMKNSTDLQDLADSLSIIQPSTAVQLPTLQNVRRQRRKNILLRNKSPTLSPIHESGFSNPASPQLACKHACSISSLSTSGTLCGNKAEKQNK